MSNISEFLEELNEVRENSLNETFDNSIQKLKQAIAASPLEENFTVNCPVELKDFYLMKFKELDVKVVTFTHSPSLYQIHLK